MTTNTQRPTPRSVKQSRELMRQIAEPTALERAAARMHQAKAQWTDAALAAQRGDKNAPALADAALLELNAARDALRQLTIVAPMRSARALSRLRGAGVDVLIRDLADVGDADLTPYQPRKQE